MKHVVFLVGEYYPDFSANGLCCFNVAEEVAKSDSVTVICLKSRTNQPTIEEYQGQTVVRVTNNWWELRLKFTKGMKSTTGLKRLLFLIGLRFVQVKDYMEILLSKRSLKKGIIKEFLRTLRELDVTIDAIIPLCFPMEAVAAGMIFKREKISVKLLPYLFDPYLESHTLHRTKWNQLLKKKNNAILEKEMLEISTKVFCINHLKDHFSTNYEEYKGKIITNEHPLIKRGDSNNTKVKKNPNLRKDNINIFYAGVFDNLIRNPDYFLKLIIKAFKGFDANLHLYSYGNCSNIVREYAAISDNKIIDYGFTPKDIVNKTMFDSDILICVGNIDNLQVPSKIIEYMAVGKPIILFYTFEADANLNILIDYPFALCLKQEESLLEENTMKFISFCKENKGKNISFDEIEEKYYYATPRYITKQILDIIYE